MPRLRSAGFLALAVVALALVTLMLLWNRSDKSDVDAEPVRLADGVSAKGRGMPIAPLMRSGIAVDTPVEPMLPQADPAAGAGLPGIDLAAELEALVERLEHHAQVDPEGYPERARTELEQFHARVQSIDTTERCTALVHFLAPYLAREGLDTPEGLALLTLLGGWGGVEQVLLRCGRAGEAFRAGVAGCVWALEAQRAEGVLTIDPAEYSRFSPRLGPLPVAVTLDRACTPQLEGVLTDRARRFAEDPDALEDRDLAILALGCAVDSDPHLLDVFADILFDTAPEQMQARPAICFVLARARGAAPRELLRRFLGDPQLGRYGKELAGLWLAEVGGDPIALQQAAETLASDESSHLDRTMAMGVLSRRLQTESPEERALVVELLCLQVLREKNDSLRQAAIAFLGDLATGDARMAALVGALFEDPSPRVRKAAAQALSRTRGAEVAEALAHLVAARVRETDPLVREAIDAALSWLGGG